MSEPAQPTIDPTLPPFVRKMLEAGYVVESIRLDSNGRWWHRGNPVEHQRIAQLFSRNVARTDGGTWVLEIGRFTYPIEVDDTPRFVSSWALGPEGSQTELHLTTGDTVSIALDALRWDDRGLVAVLSDG